MFDIIKNGDLREQLIELAERCLDSGSNIPAELSYNASIYRIALIKDHIEFKKSTGFLLSVFSEKNKELDNVMEYKAYGKNLNLRLLKNTEHPDKDMETVLDFFKQVYGSSASHVTRLTKKLIEARSTVIFVLSLV